MATPAPSKRTSNSSRSSSARASSSGSTVAVAVAGAVSSGAVSTGVVGAETSSALDARAAERVYKDLREYLAASDEPRRRLKFLAAKTGIHEKTLQRLARGLNKPTYMTVFKVYRHLLNETDDVKLLAAVPVEISAYLKKANPQSLEGDKTYSSDVERELIANPIAAELVILCATGPIQTAFVRTQFGDYGLKVMANLVERNVLAMVSRDQVCSGQVQVNISPETVAAFGIQMSRSYLRPDLSYMTGRNFLGFYAEGLTEAARQAWLKIDADAFNEKVKLAKLPENRGDVRAFTFYATDIVDIKESK